MRCESSQGYRAHITTRPTAEPDQGAHDVDVASVARLIGDPSRAAMLLALMDGRALTAGELTRIAGLAPATTSAHLSKLLDAGMVAMVAQGRHRYFRLSGAPVAEALEALSQLGPPATTTSLRMSSAARALRPARMCYDHVAGRLGVCLHDHLIEIGGVVTASSGLELTHAGEQWFQAFGVDIAAVRARRRAPLRTCLDWTERRWHMAGGLAASLADTMLDQAWLVRRGAGERGLDVTTLGAQRLTSLLDQPIAATRGVRSTVDAAS